MADLSYARVNRARLWDRADRDDLHPCVGGVSRNETEDLMPEWSTAGVNVLMHAVLEKAEIVS
jgi:hypothetical protein